MRFTTEDYADAISRLRRASDQLEPDGRLCTVCEDNDHQAFECDKNPLVAERRARDVSTLMGRVHEIIHDAMGV